MKGLIKYLKTRDRGNVAIPVMLFCCIAVYLLCYGLAYGDGIPFTYDRAEGFVSLLHYTDCDSARVYFGYPDSTNFYENVKLSPLALDSSYLYSTALELDSLGTHQVRTWYWERGSADSTQEPLFWYHSNYGDLFAVGVPGAPNLCNVNGILENSQGTPYDGAIVEAIRVSGTVGIDTTSSTVIVGSTPVSILADSIGVFQLQLRRTTDYADTTKGFYDITGSYGGETLFEVKRFYVPDQDAVNIGNTILTRGN